MSSMRTTVEITENAASSPVSDVSTGLPKSRDEQRRTQLVLSVLAQAALLMWLQCLRSDYHTRGLARHIAATADCRLFDS